MERGAWLSCVNGVDIDTHRDAEAIGDRFGVWGWWRRPQRPAAKG